MNTIKIAFRNIFRNGRRSLMTVLAIAVGGLAILLFGGFVNAIILGFQTGIVQRVGHLAVFRNGYYDFGSGNPGAYGIADYDALMKTIRDDPQLAPLVTMVTPGIQFSGIAGNFAADASRIFLGTGMVPSDREKMLDWNEYGLSGGARPVLGLHDNDSEGGVIGTGLARILKLCDALKVKHCPQEPVPEQADNAKPDASILELGKLADQDQPAANAPKPDTRPRIDLLAATAGGAPNVVSLYLNGAEPQGIREFNDAYVGMDLRLAQKLLFGRGEPKVTGITIQLARSQDVSAARARLNQIFQERKLPLEVRDYTELQPIYLQVLAMFGAIFFFISIIMAVIVIFTVVNTMSMSVMERINEIGTLRAMGVRRSGIRRQFLAEGWFLGMIGASLGVLLAILAAFLVNTSHVTWTPPTSSDPVPLNILLTGGATLLVGSWVGLVVIATLAALVPANRAARMQVVDALRHV